MLPETLLLKLNTYNIMIVIGLISAFIVLYLYCKNKDVDFEFFKFISTNGIISVFVGFLSASLFQSLYNYIGNKTETFILGGGYTFIGGLIGGTACFLIIYSVFSKNYSQKLASVISIIPCCILIAHAFGRLGCFFEGCCYGIQTDTFLGVKFPRLDDKVYPTQLFEAIFLFALFGICSYLLIKKDFKYNLSLYLIAYGIFRFLIEFIRGDDRGAFIGAISPSQFWAIIMIVTGLVFLIVMKKKSTIYH